MAAVWSRVLFCSCCLVCAVEELLTDAVGSDWRTGRLACRVVERADEGMERWRDGCLQEVWVLLGKRWRVRADGRTYWRRKEWYERR